MIGVIDLSLGNIASVVNMFKKIGVRAEAVSAPERLSGYDRLVLPGVGAFDRGMERLEAAGLREALEREVIGRGTPILGICLGLQLFCRKSEEGVRPGLGWIPVDVVRFRPDPKGALRVPHMGWSEVCPSVREPLFGEFLPYWKFYFLHSYHVSCADPRLVLATCRYGVEFPCALRSGPVWGVQFHPEKSHRFGMRLLKNFVESAA